MRFTQCLFIAVALLVFSSCRKHQNNSVGSYYPLNPGNYWIYETYRLDSSYNVENATNLRDSFYVEKDTIISGKVYHKYVGPDDYGHETDKATFLRDSLGFLKDNQGNVHFTSRDFKTTFYRKYMIDLDHQISNSDTTYLVEKRMGDRDLAVAMPAGTFTTSSWQNIYTMNRNVSFNTPRIRTLHNRYAAGVGMVSQTKPFYLSEPWYAERRLVRYHVQ